MGLPHFTIQHKTRCELMIRVPDCLHHGWNRML